MIRKKVFNYLLRLMDDYPSSRMVIYEGEKCSPKEEIRCGAPQVSLLGLFIGFTYNVLILCVVEDLGILKLRINQNLWQTKRWLDSRSLEVVSEKTKVLLVGDRKYLKYPKIVLGKQEVAWSTIIKYLRVPERNKAIAMHSKSHAIFPRVKKISRASVLKK